MNKNIVFTLFLLSHLPFLFLIYPINIYQATTKGHWEPILVGYVMETFFLWVYLKGLSTFPIKNMTQIFSERLGKWLARAILAPYFLFLFMKVVLIGRSEIDNINVVLLIKTPILFTLLLYAIPLYAAWKGLQSITRGGVAILLLGLPLIIFALLSSIREYDFHYIFPLLDAKMTFFKSSGFYSILSFHSGFLFLGMINLKKVLSMRQCFSILIFLFVLGLMTVYVPILVFGAEAVIHLRYPIVSTSDIVDAEWIALNLFPSFFVVAAIGLSLAEAALSIWMMMDILQRLVYPSKIGSFALLGIASYVCSAIIPNAEWLNRLNLWNSGLCIYSIIVLPIAIWIVSIRSGGNKEPFMNEKAESGAR